jgi:formylglycine-generating enzyme
MTCDTAQKTRIPGAPFTMGSDRSVPSWLTYVTGASWQTPEGPGSDAADRPGHPVVHVSCRDAQAYAAWADKRLPTKAESERAARGGIDGQECTWADELRPGSREMANTWAAGQFPALTPADREPGTKPAGHFRPTGYGLCDMTGNVWEWTTSPYQPGHHLPQPCCAGQADSTGIPADPLRVGMPLRTLKGGSYLCAANYCARYRRAARTPQAKDGSASNIGFRCAASAPAKDTHPWTS